MGLGIPEAGKAVITSIVVNYFSSKICNDRKPNLFQCLAERRAENRRPTEKPIETLESASVFHTREYQGPL